MCALPRLFALIICCKLCIVLILLLFYKNELKQQPPAARSELRIDKSDMPSWQQRLQLMRKEMPAFPLEELLARPKSKPKGCSRLPNLMDIKFHNNYWQAAQAENLTYYIYGAYYDNRATVEEAPLVRILTMSTRYGKRNEVKFPQVYCQLWYKNQTEPLLVNVSDHKIIWIFGGAPKRVYPTLLSCALPQQQQQQQVPEMVSLVATRCELATNLLRVVYEPRKRVEPATKPRFMVCVKALNYPYSDLSWRLIEWLELLRLLGADKVVFYEAQMHANMSKVIEHYSQQAGYVELRPLSLGRGEPHAAPNFHYWAMSADGFNRRLNEMIPYNDCFYRNMYNYDYIGVFDIDEIIMPLGNLTSWSQLIDVAQRAPDYQRESSRCQHWASFCFRNVYFPSYAERAPVYPALPSYYYMLQHVERSPEHCNRYAAVKCLHSTRYVEALHNHFPLFFRRKHSCDPKSVPIQYAQMQHYREPTNKTRLLNPIRDDNIWRFQPQLQQRVHDTYKQLGFLPDEL